MSKKKDKVKKTAGRPQIKIDWDEVAQILQETGCKNAEVLAEYMGTSYPTMLRRFKEDFLDVEEGEIPEYESFDSFLRAKRKKGELDILRKQYNEAMEEGNWKMLIFLGKTRCKQVEAREQKEQNNNMPNITVNFTPPIQKDSGDGWDDE